MSWVIPPAYILKKWPKPNYVNPVTNHKYTLGLEIPALVLSFTIVGLRIFVRKVKVVNGKIQLDDWLILIATLFTASLTAVNFAAIPYGWGRHSWDTKPQNWSILIKFGVSAEMIFAFSICFTKLSIIAFYWHVFCNMTTTSFTRYSLYALIVYVITWTLASLGIAIFQCLPVASIWDMSVKGKCSNIFASFTTMAVLNSISDFALFILPIPIVLQLRLPKRQKIGLIVTFGLGLVCIIAGFLRMYNIYNMLHNGGTSYDMTWYGNWAYMTTSVELNLGIICASLPSLRALLVRMFRRDSNPARSREENPSAPSKNTDASGGKTLDESMAEKSNYQNTISNTITSRYEYINESELEGGQVR